MKEPHVLCDKMCGSDVSYSNKYVVPHIICPLCMRRLCLSKLSRRLKVRVHPLQMSILP